MYFVLVLGIAMSRKLSLKTIKINGQIQVLLLLQNKDFMMTMIIYCNELC